MMFLPDRLSVVFLFSFVHLSALYVQLARAQTTSCFEGVQVFYHEVAFFELAAAGEIGGCAPSSGLGTVAGDESSLSS